jgi:hypothetical protein
MSDFTAGAIAAGVVTSALVFCLNHAVRGWLWPIFKNNVQDRPVFSGEWEHTLAGGGGEGHRLYLSILHYAPYVRGELLIEKEKAGQLVSKSHLKLTGYICDNHVALAGRTMIKERRSISTLILEINATSRVLKGKYCFRCLELGALQSVDVAFRRGG